MVFTSDPFEGLDAVSQLWTIDWHRLENGLGLDAGARHRSSVRYDVMTGDVTS